VIGSCFDIGGATCAALSRFTQSGDALRSGDTAENSSGNGSIMRLAPVPIKYAKLFPDSIGELARLASELSLTTHASEQCLSACRYMTLVLAGLLNGIHRDEVLAPDWQPVVQLAKSTPLHPAIVHGGVLRGKRFLSKTISTQVRRHLQLNPVHDFRLYLLETSGHAPRCCGTSPAVRRMELA